MWSKYGLLVSIMSVGCVEDLSEPTLCDAEERMAKLAGTHLRDATQAYKIACETAALSSRNGELRCELWPEHKMLEKAVDSWIVATKHATTCLRNEGHGTP